MSDLTLHGYWRSSASYRVRIALALKGVDYAQVAHDLRSGAQRAPDYQALAPQGLVPALADGDSVLTQSGAEVAGETRRASGDLGARGIIPPRTRGRENDAVL